MYEWCFFSSGFVGVDKNFTVWFYQLKVFQKKKIEKNTWSAFRGSIKKNLSNFPFTISTIYIYWEKQ